MASRVRALRWLLPLVLLLVGPALAQENAVSTVEWAQAPLSVVETEQGPAVEGWTFESVGYKPNEGNGRVVTVGPEGQASLQPPAKGDGVVLAGAALTARGDLLSAPFDLEPYRWVEVSVEYEVLGGEPMVMVGLRPEDDRRIVDIAFLPGGRRRAKVSVHSSDRAGPYRLALAVGGEGTVRFDAVDLEGAGPYERPERPILVLDIRSADPELKPSANLARVAALFGFPGVEYLHYTRFDAREVRRIEPALVILPGLWSSKGTSRKAMDEAARGVAKLGIPIVGLCLGHQVLARAHGATIRKGTKEWGATRIEASARDPLFKGLPRGRVFINSESHRYEVARPLGRMRVLASSEGCTNQIFRYRGKPFYTFQGHIERGWDVASPEALQLWKNMLRIWRISKRP